MLQRFQFSTHHPDLEEVEYVRLEDVRMLLRTLYDEASPCSTACHSLIPNSALEAVFEEVGMWLYQ